MAARPNNVSLRYQWDHAKDVTSVAALKGEDELLALAQRDDTRRTVHDKHYPYAGAPTGIASEYTYVERTVDAKWDIPNHPDFTRKVAQQLLASDHKDVILAVANGKHTDARTLTELSGHADDHVRIAAVRHPTFPTAGLQLHQKDSSPYVRRVLATRADTPDEVLSNLVTDPSHMVRERLTRRENVPEEVLTRLAGDESHRIRRSLLDRPVLPAATLRALSSDEKRRIRRKAAKRLDRAAKQLNRLPTAA